MNDLISYALVKHGDEHLILAEKRLGEFISRFQDSKLLNSNLSKRRQQELQR